MCTFSISLFFSQSKTIANVTVLVPMNSFFLLVKIEVDCLNETFRWIKCVHFRRPFSVNKFVDISTREKKETNNKKKKNEKSNEKNTPTT